MPSMPQSTKLSMPQFSDTLSMPQLPMLSMPQSTTLSTQLPTLSMLPQLSTLPQLTMPQFTMPQLRLTPMRSPPTPTLLLMTTPSLASTLRNNPMVLPTLPDLTPLLFLMAPMRELLSTQRLQLQDMLQPQLTTLKSEIPQ